MPNPIQHHPSKIKELQIRQNQSDQTETRTNSGSALFNRVRSESSRCLLWSMFIYLFLLACWLNAVDLPADCPPESPLSVIDRCPAWLQINRERNELFRLLFRNKNHNVIMLIFALFLTNQHPPGSAHKRGSPAPSRSLIGGGAVDIMMTFALVYKK